MPCGPECRPQPRTQSPKLSHRSMLLPLPPLLGLKSQRCLRPQLHETPRLPLSPSTKTGSSSFTGTNEVALAVPKGPGRGHLAKPQCRPLLDQIGMAEIVCIEPQAYSIQNFPTNVLLTRQRSRSRSSASYSTSTHLSNSDCLIRVSSRRCHYAAVWTLIIYLLVGGICMKMELIFLSIFQPGC